MATAPCRASRLALCVPRWRWLVGTLLVYLLWWAASPALAQVHIATLPLGSPRASIKRVAFSPDGKTIAALGYGPIDQDKDQANILLWDVKTRKLQARLKLGHSSPAFLLAFTPGSKSLVCSCSLGGGIENPKYAIQVWDLNKKEVPLTIEPPGNCGQTGALTPDGKTLVLCQEKVHLYDLRSGKRQAALAVEERVGHVAISKDGKWLAMAHYQGKLSLWDLEARKCRWTVDAHETKGACYLDFSSDSENIATISWGHIKIWGRTKDNPLRSLDLNARGGFLSSRGIAYIKDTKRVITTGSTFEPGIFVWDHEYERLYGGVKLPKPIRKYVFDMAVSPDGTLLATGHKDVQLWDIRGLLRANK